MAMTHSSDKRRQTSNNQNRSSNHGVLSERVSIPAKPSNSFVAKLRKSGAGEGTIRRVTGK